VQITVLAFAHTRDQLGFSERTLACEAEETPRAILRRIAPRFDPGKTIRVAVDREYADWDKPIGRARELALIPPVSGG
jgi:sulfur-carrier protein